MIFEHPDAFRGEHVVTTDKVSLTIKDSLNLADVLHGGYHASLGRRGYNDEKYSGYAVYFPVTEVNSACIAANVVYMPSDAAGAINSDMRAIMMLLIDENLVDEGAIQKYDTEDGVAGIKVQLQDENAFVTIAVGSSDLIGRSEGEVTIVADLLPSYDEATSLSVLKQTMLLWGGVEYALRKKNHDLNKPINIVLEDQYTVEFNLLLNAADEYVSAYDTDKSLPKLDIDTDDLSALHEVYRLDTEEFTHIVRTIALKIQDAYQDLPDFDPEEDLPDITLAAIVARLEQARQRS